MVKLCMKYDEEFKSGLKRLGFVAKLFSETKVRKLRELNNALALKTGYKITVINLTDKKGKRRIAFFDVKTMLVRDKKASKGSKERCLKDIVEQCGDGVNAYLEDGKSLNKDAFVRAKNMFNSEMNFSQFLGAEINVKSSKQKARLKKLRDSLNDVEHKFVADETYSSRIDLKDDYEQEIGSKVNTTTTFAMKESKRLKLQPKPNYDEENSNSEKDEEDWIPLDNLDESSSSFCDTTHSFLSQTSTRKMEEFMNEVQKEQQRKEEQETLKIIENVSEIVR